MSTALETRLREAEGRVGLLENLYEAAALLNEAGVPIGDPQARQLIDELVAALPGRARRPLRESARDRLAHAGIPMLPGAPSEVVRLRESAYTTAARRVLAKEGKARPDGSYPILTAKDLADALDDFNRSGGSPEDKAHIIARAKAIGAADKLPEDWSDGKARLQESATGLAELGIPLLDEGGAVGAVRLREATSAADLARLGIPTLDDSPQASKGAAALARAGIPILPEPPGAASDQHRVRLLESESGRVLRRLA